MLLKSKSALSRTYIFILMTLLIIGLSACSNGGSSDNGPVKVSLAVDAYHGAASRIVSVEEAVDLSSFVFFYKATPQWTGSEFASITGQTVGFVKINSYRDGKVAGSQSLKVTVTNN